jgi:hypothetical protein
MSTTNARRPRFARAADSISAMKMTQRDLEILRLVAEHRFVRSTHLISLLGGSRVNLLRRLQKLYHHGYLERPHCQIDYYHKGGTRPMVYGLASRGAGRLRRDLDIPFHRMGWDRPSRFQENPGRLFLNHALLITDIMVTVELACRETLGTRVLSADQIPNAGSPLPQSPLFKWNVKVKGHRSLGIIPDKVFGLEFSGGTEGRNQIWFFLEADCGSMPVIRKRLDQTSIYRKLVAYAESWTQKVHTEKFGLSRFRVLTVTTSGERSHDMAEAAKKLERGHGLFLFTDSETLMAAPDVFKHLWQAVNGTETLIPLQEPE